MTPSETFIGYKHLDVHFIYGFLWRSSVAVPDQIFRDGLPEKRERWRAPLLHERVIGSAPHDDEEKACIGAYQPTFVLHRRCLETSGIVGKTGLAWLVVPMEHGVSLPAPGSSLPDGLQEDESDLTTIPIVAAWTLRLFDAGTGTFTVRTMRGDIDSGPNGFRIAHWMLHLAPSLDTFPEEHPNAARESPQISVTDSFLFTPEFGTFRMFDYFRSQLVNALGDLPVSAVVRTNIPEDTARPMFKFDEQGLLPGPPKTKPARPTPVKSSGPANWRENQAPFAFVTATADGESISKLGGTNGQSHSLEIASLCTRVAFSNSEVHEGYGRFPKDALVSLLRYDPREERLLNLCRDDRLFAAFSSRGALSLTELPRELPALFYIPSLLNLFEILRARQYGAVVVGSRIAQLASQLSLLNTNSQPIDYGEYAELRRRVVANLQDPLQYLFDGGSLTDLAVAANAALFVAATWSNVDRAIEALDRLVTTWEVVRFRRRHGGPDAG